MNNALALIGLFVLTSLVFSCDPNASSDVISLETFISELKSNKYASPTLPAFTARDIPELLEYRNATDRILSFPRNPVSSLHEQKCYLGMLVLWTIEAIRTESVTKDSFVDRFLSQNPVLAVRDADVLELADEAYSHRVAADAYYTWWTQYAMDDFSAAKGIDPLENTAVKWH